MNNPSLTHRRFLPNITQPAALLLGLLAFGFSATAAATNTLNPGQILGGSITGPEQTNFYSFTASSNDVIYLTLLKTNGPGNYPYFYLYDPAGEILPEPGYNSFEANWGGRLTKSGTYTVGIIDNELNESFDYLLSLTVIGADNLREPGDGALAIVPGQITSG